MNDQQEITLIMPDRDRVRSIIKMAAKLNWIYPIEQSNKRNYSYPLMQLSEVEKCMLAMTDEWEFNRLVEWTKDIPDKQMTTVTNGSPRSET